MEKFKVTPTNIRNGATALYFVISLSANGNKNQKADAEKQAIAASRLSSFDNWLFEVEKI